MDAKQELANMLKGFVVHCESNELLFKTAQKKKGYKGSTYLSWLETRMAYWLRHYNHKYNSHITIGEAKAIYDELPKNHILESTSKLEMKR